MPRRLRQARLVGRLAETGALDEALRTAAEANPVAVIIAGDAGIGNGGLAAEVCSRAAAEGWQLLSAGCIDLAEGSVPYLALVDALRSLTAKELPTSPGTLASRRDRAGNDAVTTGHGSRPGLRGLPRPAAGKKRRGTARAHHRGRALG